MAKGVRCEVVVQEKERMRATNSASSAFHGETDSHACLLIVTLLCLGTRLCNSGVRFYQFHSGSLHERWGTFQGAELDMNGVFIDIILTPPKAGIVQISPQKELSHHIRRIDGTARRLTLHFFSHWTKK